MRSCLNGGGGGAGGGGVQSAYDGGECSPLTGGGGGRQDTLTNSSIACTHSLLKHKGHHGKRVHSAPALSCSTASLTFVRTTELSGLLSMAQHVICRSLSSGRGGGGGGGGGGRQKLPGGGISYAMGGGGGGGGRHFIRDGRGGAAAPPPPPPPLQGYAGSGAGKYNDWLLGQKGELQIESFTTRIDVL